MMKKIITLLLVLSLPLSTYAFHYWPELDGGDGFFIITGDNAVSGFLMLIGCAVLAYIGLKLAEVIGKDEKAEGIRKTIANVFYAISGIACIATIALAFTLWWISLILLVVFVIGSAIYQKITDK